MIQTQAPNASRLSPSAVAVTLPLPCRWAAPAAWGLIAALAILFLCARPALGQAANYKSEPLNEVYKNAETLRQMSGARREGLRKADLGDRERRIFVAYYSNYLFGKLKDPAYLSEYGTIVRGILDDMERAQRQNLPSAQMIGRLVISQGYPIANDNYHPVARVNATLLLAMLDEQPADMRNNRPPKPSSDALTALGRLYGNADAPDGVHAAALQGIARHAYYNAVPQNARVAIADRMLTLAKSDPPEGRSPEAHAYLQRYAVDILTSLARQNIPDDKIQESVQTFVSLSTRKENPTLIAAYAASRLGELQPDKVKVNRPSRVLSDWAARGALTIDKELNRLARLEPPVAVRDQPPLPTAQTTRRPVRGRGGEGYDEDYDGAESSGYDGDYEADMSGDYDGYGREGRVRPGQVNPQPVEVVASRRRINHVLEQLQMGATGQKTAGAPTTPAGLAAGLADGDRDRLTRWVTTISEVVTAVNDESLDDRKKFAEALREQAAVLRTLAGVPVESEEQMLPTADLDGSQMVGALPGEDGEGPMESLRPAIDGDDAEFAAPVGDGVDQAAPDAAMPAPAAQPRGPAQPQPAADAEPAAAPLAPVVPGTGDDF